MKPTLAPLLPGTLALLALLAGVGAWAFAIEPESLRSTSILPVRFLVPPEISILELKRRGDRACRGRRAEARPAR